MNAPVSSGPAMKGLDGRAAVLKSLGGDLAATARPRSAGTASWAIDDIPYHTLASRRIDHDEQLFQLVTSASFIEITTSFYAQNLAQYFRGDSEIVGWLEQVWENEELQHGKALKRYVQTAWPDFDWDAAYQDFLAEYAPLCTVDRFAATKALEMAARCVVETGTATFYRALSACCQEPVLQCLAAKIADDEIRHYKHFYRYFLRYRSQEQTSRMAVLQTLWNRSVDVDREDALCAFKAVFRARHPAARFHIGDYESWRDGVMQLLRPHFPRTMAIKMLFKPLRLPAIFERAVLPVVALATRLVLAALPREYRRSVR
jgi:hypothetical protein